MLDELFHKTIAAGEHLLTAVEAEDSVRLAAAVATWDNQAQLLLEGSFTGATPARGYPTDLDPDYLTGGATVETDEDRIREELERRLLALRAIRDLLGLYAEPADAIGTGRDHPASQVSSTVFIVHGRADGPKHEVARYLETATNAEPIILHEQAKRGRVIIETLEEYAAVAAFAVVLLTADDHGGIAGSPGLQARARQNVVFELGFFIGALGRSRVAVLYEEGVELPSDMNGILYTVLDAPGAWKLSLGRELRSGGFAVDLNRAT